MYKIIILRTKTTVLLPDFKLFPQLQSAQYEIHLAPTLSSYYPPALTTQIELCY